MGRRSQRGEMNTNLAALVAFAAAILGMLAGAILFNRGKTTQPPAPVVNVYTGEVVEPNLTWLAFQPSGEQTVAEHLETITNAAYARLQSSGITYPEAKAIGYVLQEVLECSGGAHVGEDPAGQHPRYDLLKQAAQLAPTLTNADGWYDLWAAKLKHGHD